MSTFSLSGTGVQAIAAGVGQLHVHVTTLPGDVGFGRANPSNLYGAGFITPSDGSFYWRPQPIDAVDCWIGLPKGSTQFGYSLLNGTAADATEVVAENPFVGSTGAAGATGATGAAGSGVPTGGTTAQVLAKASSTDFDTHWVAASSGSGFPTIAEAIPASNVAVSANTTTDVCSFSLAAGDWIVWGNALSQFSPASHGEYRVTDGTNTLGGARDVDPGGSWYIETSFHTKRFTLAATTTVTLQIRWEQNGNVFLNTTANSWGPATVMHAMQVG